MKSYTTIDAYIKDQPRDVQILLKQMRATIHKAAPTATEAMKYGIPTFILNENLVHFGGFKNHLGFFPTPAGIANFSKEVSKYQTTKGTIQFPLDKKLPLALVTKITKFRVKQVMGKMKNSTSTISEYNKLQTIGVKKICDLLELSIDTSLKKSESKIWHGTPVWFMEGNPIVSYSVRKNGSVSLMFFSGQSFEEKGLKPEGKFKAAEIFYTDVKEIKATELKKWLKKAETIQWDYKNIVKRKGVLKKILTEKKGGVK